MSAPTVASIAREIRDEWIDADYAGTPEDFVMESIGEAVPAMTTTLFGMVVADNALAFLDAPVESGEPFAVLASAIGAEVERQALELIRADRELDQ